MATAGYGTLLKRSGTTIAEVRNISGPNLALGTVETTHHTSTGGWREHIGTLLDAGEVTAELNFLPGHATQSFAAGLVKDLKDKTLQTFSITFTDAVPTVWTFTAFVTQFAITAPVDGKLTANVTLKISGQPTLA